MSGFSLVPTVSVGTQVPALRAGRGDAERHERIPTRSVGTRKRIIFMFRQVLPDKGGCDLPVKCWAHVVSGHTRRSEQDPTQHQQISMAHGDVRHARDTGG